ncbi:outer membrane beta-barrel protein [Mariniflexile sp.]|uniref:outer membrane beta-barrel protein n=1 Tax=Mariniflexile sp. TaxID=1979402 RepID=UPI0040477632
MKKINIVKLILLLISTISFGQVKDISVTLSPAAEYTLWDDMSGLEDGVLIGGKVGFGFGEYIELRATYMQALDLKTNFKDFGLVNYSDALFTARDVKLTRIGGEFKANFGTKTKLNPYFTLGTGVQTIQLESQNEQEQIFATAGLGAKFNIGKRAVFALEAKNTMYNFNAGSRLLTDADKTTFGVTNADFSVQRLSNWSAMASLQFYLGGRKPGSLTELDKAYLKSFSSGFSGIRLVLEPGLANITFDNDSNFRDTWMLGGYFGLDFNEYIGLRGFYYKSSKDEQISTDFDELSMYGMEFRARLNDGNGVVPYLVLGGGYLNTTNDYLGKDGLPVDGSYFASGGLGLNIPLAKGLLVYGGVRALLTSDSDEVNIQNPDQIQTHIMYNFGIKIALGKKAKSPTSVYNENLNDALNEQQALNDEKIAKLKTQYKDKIAQLETDLNTAYESKDIDKAVEILEEKKATTEALKEVEAVEVVASKAKVAPQNNGAEKKIIQSTPATNMKQVDENEPLVQMTPQEFELLIQRILNEVESNPLAPDFQKKSIRSENDEQIFLLNKRVEKLEKLLLQINNGQLNNRQSNSTSRETLDSQQSDNLSLQILEKLDELNKKIDSNSNKIEARQLEKNPQSMNIKPVGVDTELNNAKYVSNESEDNEEINPLLTFQDASFFAGFMFGDETAPVAGVRLNYGIENSKILFVPELFFGFSNPTLFGLSGNGIIPININNTTLKPYAGAGAGFISFDGNTKFNTNIILGTYANVLNGKFFVDFTTRNLLDYNQLSVGYTFKL